MPAPNLDRLFTEAQAMAAKFFRDSGQVMSIISGMNDRGPTCSIIESQEQATDFTANTTSSTAPALFLPGPFQTYQPVVKDWFTAHRTTIALWKGEVWLYPEGDAGAQASEEFLLGRGARPSEHPDRREAVFVYVTCPLRGYARMSTATIVRRNHRPAALDAWIDSRAEDRTDSPFGWLSSWLEECLPAPDDRA